MSVQIMEENHLYSLVHENGPDRVIRPYVCFFWAQNILMIQIIYVLKSINDINQVKTHID